MLASGRSRAVRAFLAIAAALLLGLIAVSRLVLQLHSVPEIAAAFAIGGVSLAVFAFHPGSRQSAGIGPGQMLALILLIAVAYLMPRISGEALILQAVRRLQ